MKSLPAFGKRGAKVEIKHDDPTRTGVLNSTRLKFYSVSPRKYARKGMACRILHLVLTRSFS